MPPPQNDDRDRDHDLLVRLDTKLDQLSADFREMKTSLSGKADAARVDKLESQVEDTKRRLYMMAGGLVVIEALLRYAGK